MKKLLLLLLFALFAIVVKAESQQYQVHYIVNIDDGGDSTALYQRVVTKNPDEPYTIGDVVRYLHNGSKMVAEREYGLYEKGDDLYATVTIDGKQYFISAYTISGNDASGLDWVYEGLPEGKKGKGVSWWKILLIVGGGLLLLGKITGAPSSSSSTSSGKTSYQIQEERRKGLEKQGRKGNDEWHDRWREQLKKDGKW